MKSYCWVALIGVFVVGPTVGPAAASASPLLSGYGGPGQGNQAILGSTLLNEPPSGGGPSGTAGGGSSSAAGSSSANEPAPAAGSGSVTGGKSMTGDSGKQASGGDRKTRKGGSSRQGSSVGRGGGRGGRGGGVPEASADRSAAYSTVVLGLSDTDLLEVVLALVALVFTAFITGRAAGMNAAGRRGY